MDRSNPVLLDQRLAYTSAEEIKAAFPDVDVDVVEGCAPVMHPSGDAYRLRCFDLVTDERDVLSTRADVLGYLRWHRLQGKQVMTADDDPAIHAAAVVAPTRSTASGVDMSVQPTEVEGRAATFRLTYRNHSPAPVAIALLAHDSEERLRFRPEPAEPVVVPVDRAGSIVVQVGPKVRQLVGVPQAYTLVFRALQLWTLPENNVELVREAHFTYVPYVRLPALARVPARVPVWVRRLPMWTGALALVLLVLLLVLAAGRTRASTTTQPRRPQPRVTSPTLVLSRPSVRHFTLVHPHQGQPYELLWQTRASKMTKTGHSRDAPRSRVWRTRPGAVTSSTRSKHFAPTWPALIRACVDGAPSVCIAGRSGATAAVRVARPMRQRGARPTIGCTTQRSCSPW